LAANGNIFNHMAVRGELEGAGFVGGTETLLWAREPWGFAGASRV
jgi:hypothetical protein